MNNQIIQPFSNDFIKDHVTDTAYEEIVKELSTRKRGEKRGKRLELTVQKLRTYLYWISLDETAENAAILSGIGIAAKDKYHKFSPTFVRLQSLAKDNLIRIAKIGLARAIKGQPPQYYPIVHPRTKEIIYVELGEVRPSLKAILWYLEKKKVFDKETTPYGADQSGAPRNEKEAKLLELVLKRHHEYIQGVSKQN